MRRMIATCLVLAVAGSCSQSPSTPDSATPDSATPDSATPDSATPYTTNPDTTAAVSPAAESSAKGATAEGATVNDATADESPVEGSAAELQTAAPLAGVLQSERASERTSRLVVGDQAPDFRLQDQTGTERTLTDLVAEGKVALVFYRSADW